ncbi:OpgC domain-containing protein [Frigidibacter sp. MR17.24]|uniref:OpgC domain-containing protein n=1 Tax=Frigidibacter sp. MR17.24 TaxID=3127345 RepID=UPI003012CB40
MRRYAEIDGFRGLFLLLMTLTHAGLTLGSKLPQLYHGVTWADAAHGFVFMSGLVIGIVYTRKLARSGAAAMRQAMWGRIRLVWAYAVGLAALVYLFRFAPDLSPTAVTLFDRYGQAPELFVLLSAALLDGPKMADVLQLYLVFMLFTPTALRLIAHGRALGLGAICLGLWVFGQIGTFETLLAAADRALGLDRQGLHLGLYFSYFGWAPLYFGGLMIGAQVASGRFDPLRLREPQWRMVAWVCLAGVIAIFLLKRLSPSPLPLPVESKETFSPLYVFNTLSYLGLFTWLLIAGPVSGSAIVRLAAAALRWIVTLRPLVMLGQHSLQIYAWHVAVLYACLCLLPWTDFSRLQRDLITLAITASLFLPAWLLSRGKALPPAPSLSSSPE